MIIAIQWTCIVDWCHEKKGNQLPIEIINMTEMLCLKQCL